MNEQRLEHEIRKSLQYYRTLLQAGKGTWGHPGYIGDSTWNTWRQIAVTLEDILANAKRDDG